MRLLCEMLTLLVLSQIFQLKYLRTEFALRFFPSSNVADWRAVTLLTLTTCLKKEFTRRDWPYNYDTLSDLLLSAFFPTIFPAATMVRFYSWIISFFSLLIHTALLLCLFVLVVVLVCVCVCVCVCVYVCVCVCLSLCVGLCVSANMRRLISSGPRF